MKGVKTLIIILGIIVLGILGYYFYTSMQGLDNKQTDYQFTEGEEVNTDDYEGFQTETELEKEIEAQESQEAQAEAEFNELEQMDF